jgi:hypothetical protein
MYIEITASYLLRSRETGKPLPVIGIVSNAKIKVLGLSDSPNNLLQMRQKKGIFAASFVLHSDTSVVVTVKESDEISVYLMNADVIVSCLICCGTDFFRVIQDGKEKISDFTFQGYYHLCVVNSPITVKTIEKEKETDKHVSVR